MARKLENYNEQKKKQSTGSRDKCMAAMKLLLEKLKSIKQTLDAINGNDGNLELASESIDKAFETVNMMISYRQAAQKS